MPARSFSFWPIALEYVVMKKILFAFSIFLLFFLVLIPQKTNAATVCIGKLNNTCSGGTPVHCFVPNFIVKDYCCDSATTCTNYGTGGVVQTTTPSTNDVPNNNDVTVGGVDVSKCTDGSAGIQTAIGCIHVLGSSEEFLSDILRWAVGIGGGIAFLLILYAGFMIMTASGSPDRLKAGQELLTSAISGLILLIFSIFILKFIGVDILGLNAFGFGN